MSESTYPSRSRPSWDDLYAIAETQAGYFTTVQGASAGYSSQLLRKHLANGRLRRVRRGIYRLVHFPMTQHEELVTYWLWSEQLGVFSHETALMLHDLSDVLSARTHMTVPQSWQRRRLRVPDGLVLHHANVTDDERERMDALPLTSPTRTILDGMDANISPEHIELAIAQARQRGIINKDQATFLVGRLEDSTRR